MSLRKHQRGAGLLQLLFTLLTLIVAARAAITLIPIYIERGSIEKMIQESVDSIASRGDGKRELMRDIESKFSMNNIEHPSIKQLSVRTEGRNRYLVADYDVRSSFLFNIDLVVNFPEIRIDVSSIALN